VNKSIPSDWEVRRLDEVADVRLGRQRSPKNHRGLNMRPYLRAANVGWSGLLLDDVKEMNFTDEEMAIYRLEPGDIVLSEASGSADEVGKSALWDGQIRDCAFQNTLLRVRSNGPEPRYLLHCFRHLALSHAFARRSRGVGIHHIGRAALASWPIPVPPPREQLRIVETLEDHLSRLESGDVALTDAARRTAAMEMSVLAGVYSGLPLVKLAELAEIQGGIQKQPKRQPQHNAYPFLRVANVTSSGLDLSEVHFIELFDGELQRLRLAVGDLLVVEGNGSPSQIGRAASWDGSIADCVHQNHLIRVRPKRGLLPGFLEAMWNSPQNRRQLTNVASSTSGLYTLSVSKLAQLELPAPDLETQEAALGRIDAVRVARLRLDAENARARQRAAQLRRATLAAAFNGQLAARRNGEMWTEELAGV